VDLLQELHQLLMEKLVTRIPSPVHPHSMVLVVEPGLGLAGDGMQVPVQTQSLEMVVALTEMLAQVQQKILAQAVAAVPQVVQWEVVDLQELLSFATLLMIHRLPHSLQVIQRL
jgi:hypothetical protein